MTSLPIWPVSGRILECGHGEAATDVNLRGPPCIRPTNFVLSFWLQNLFFAGEFRLNVGGAQFTKFFSCYFQQNKRDG